MADGEGESWWDKCSTYVYIGIGVFGFISAIVIIGTLVYRRYQVPERDFHNVAQDQELRTAEEWTKKFKESYPVHFIDKTSPLSWAVNRVIETHPNDQMTRNFFESNLISNYDARLTYLEEHNSHKVTAKEWNDAYQKANPDSDFIVNIARKAIAEKSPNQKMTIDEFNKAVRLQIPETTRIYDRHKRNQVLEKRVQQIRDGAFNNAAINPPSQFQRSDSRTPDKPHPMTVTQPVGQQRSPLIDQQVEPINFNNESMKRSQEISPQDLSDLSKKTNEQQDYDRHPSKQRSKSSDHK